MKSISDAKWKVMKVAWNKWPILASEIFEELDELGKLLNLKKK